MCALARARIRDLADSSINESINIQHAIRPDTSTSTSGTAIDALQLCDVLQLSSAITSIEQQLCDVLRAVASDVNCRAQ